MPRRARSSHDDSVGIIIDLRANGCGRVRLVDLDDLAGLEQAWDELRRYRALREIDPHLRASIIRRCQALPSDVAAAILTDLDQRHPEAVLETHFEPLYAAACVQWIESSRS